MVTEWGCLDNREVDTSSNNNLFRKLAAQIGSLWTTVWLSDPKDSEKFYRTTYRILDFTMVPGQPRGWIAQSANYILTYKVAQGSKEENVILLQENGKVLLGKWYEFQKNSDIAFLLQQWNISSKDLKKYGVTIVQAWQNEIYEILTQMIKQMDYEKLQEDKRRRDALDGLKASLPK